MKAFLDTNLFVYASYSSFPEFNKARDFLKNCLSGHNRWCLSWKVIYEYLRVVTYPQIFPNDPLSFSQALDNVLQFTSASSVEVLQETSEHPKLLEELRHEQGRVAGNLLHDAHSVVLMREHDLQTIYTADTDFNRFKGIKVINPFKS